jgi:NAD(P)-dependent dehydrogenase (short-subunit alcohol dehydrogenase family)
VSGRLAGRTALVTGAATGMGRATAERFAAEGARVVLLGLGGAALDEAAGACPGGRAVHGDVTDAAAIEAAIKVSDGRIDILVNAAGIVRIEDPVSMTDTDWERTFAVNATAVMATCRAVLPAMIARRRGAIVNIASVAAFNPSPTTASYAASKAAVVSLTRSIAYAHGGDGIRANCVAPGWARTPMSEMEMALAAQANGTTVEAEFDALARRIALGRVAFPEEIAACCMFLASDDSSFVTGAVLVVDGGGRAPTQNRAV